MKPLTFRPMTQINTDRDHYTSPLAYLICSVCLVAILAASFFLYTLTHAHPETLQGSAVEGGK